MAVIIDRRKNPSGKSLPNRQKLLQRGRAQLRQAVKKKIGAGAIADVLRGGSVSIPIDGIREPEFHHAPGGISDRVYPGNKKFVEGDILPRPPGGGGGGGQGQGQGGGDDDSSMEEFALTEQEMLDIYLGDLALPDLVKKKIVETEFEGWRRAGYTITGSPSNMSIKKTSELALARRLALHRPSQKDLLELIELLKKCTDPEEAELLRAEIRELEKRSKRIPYIDPIDVRYRRVEPRPKPGSNAVMFCLMDVSGSMSEHLVGLAQQFFTLLYIFLKRWYPRVELVFIQHTADAREVDEDTFFHKRISGGTVVSSALDLMKEIIKERYPPSEWNIYGAQASDGDNSSSDRGDTERLILDILPLCQYFAYFEVYEENQNMDRVTQIWEIYEKIDGPLAMCKAQKSSEIYPVFRDLFKKKEVA